MSYQVSSKHFPGKLQAIAILQTVVGSLQILYGIGYFIYVLFIGILSFGIGLLAIPLPVIVLVAGILTLISGVKGLQRTPAYGLTLTAAIIQMVGLIACDFIGFGSGLATVILLTQPEVKAYYGRN